MTRSTDQTPHLEARAFCACASLSWHACCRSFGFEYGSLYLNLTETDFVQLLRTICTAAGTGANSPSEKFYIRISDRGVLMVTPQEELGQLAGLLLKGYRWLDGRYETEPPQASRAIH